MNLSWILSPWFLGTLLLLSVPGARAESFDVFVRFGFSEPSMPGIGESTDPEFPGSQGWSRVVGFEEGASKAPPDPGKGATGDSTQGPFQFDPTTLVKLIDGVSPALFRSFADGSRLNYLLFAMRTKSVGTESKTRPFYFAKAERVRVLRIEWTCDLDGAPFEKVTFDKAAFQWTIQSADDTRLTGSVTVHWDPAAPLSGEGPLPGVVLTPRSLSSAAQGMPYRQVFSVSGDTAPPYEFWMSGGLLPDGMTLSRDGVLSGTPSRNGQFTFRVAGGDFVGNFDEQTYTLVVSSGPRIHLLDASVDPSEWRIRLEGIPGRFFRIESAPSLAGPWQPEGMAHELPDVGYMEMSVRIDSFPTRFFRAVQTLTGCPTLPTGLVHWWRGESEVDQVQGEPLVAIGEPEISPGRIGNAFLFDGKDDRLSLIEEGQPGSLIERDWTLAVWVRRDDSIDASSALLLDARTAVKLEQYGQAGRRVGITWFGRWDRYFSYSAPTRVWVHLVLADTASGTALYVNGQLSEVIPDRIPLPLSTMGGGVGDRLRGAVDEMLVFDRTLSVQEIGQLYQASLKLGNCDPVP
ncbi:MAG: type VI secretion system tube protein Hcp [Verrucomicrobiales bacterium]|nr:type VI secretion system tube protein Hcp [Verrucomicrobiales bacterium]